MAIGVFGGTFDPVHLGHLDLIARSAYQLETLYVAVSINPGKTPMFNLDERLQMLEECTYGFPGNIKITSFDGLIIDFGRQVGATVLVRGLRNGSDFDYEQQMAYLNRRMAPEIDTLMLPATEGYGAISSTYVRQIAKMKGDFSSFVAASIVQRLQAKQD